MIKRRPSDFTGSLSGNLVVTGTSDLQGNVQDSGGDFTVADNLVVTGTFTSQGLATVDGLMPEADLADNLGSATLTWNELYVKTLYDQGGRGRVAFQPTDYTELYGDSANTASAIGVRIGNQTTLTAGTDRYTAAFYNDNGVTVKSYVATDGTYSTGGGALFGGTAGNTPIGKINLASALTTSNMPASWGANHMVVGSTTDTSGANSGAFGFGYDSTNGNALLYALAPSHSLKGMRFHASSYSFTDGAATPNPTFIVAAASGKFSLASGDISGTPGNGTCSTTVGKAALASGANTITVTNSLCSTSSKIFISPLSADATVVKWQVVPGSGSFVVNSLAANGAAANATADWHFDFWLIN